MLHILIVPELWMYLINNKLVSFTKGHIFCLSYVNGAIAFYSKRFWHLQIQCWDSKGISTNEWPGPICCLSALLLMDAAPDTKKDIWSHKEIQRSWWVQPLNRTICPPFSLIAFSTCVRFQGLNGSGGCVWKDTNWFNGSDIYWVVQ